LKGDGPLSRLVSLGSTIHPLPQGERVSHAIVSER